MTKGQELTGIKKENKKLIAANLKLNEDYENEKKRAEYWQNLYLHLASDRANEIKMSEKPVETNENMHVKDIVTTMELSSIYKISRKQLIIWRNSGLPHKEILKNHFVYYLPTVTEWLKENTNHLEEAGA
jgi:hypothetical protein